MATRTALAGFVQTTRREIEAGDYIALDIPGNLVAFTATAVEQLGERTRIVSGHTHVVRYVDNDTPVFVKPAAGEVWA